MASLGRMQSCLHGFIREPVGLFGFIKEPVGLFVWLY